MLPKGDATMAIPIPLEFDEEDEDFLAHDIPPASIGANGGRGAERVGVEEEIGTLASPPLSSNPSGSSDASSLPSMQAQATGGGHEEDLLQGWNIEDMQAVEDREPFYDISAAGLMDEEQI